MHAETTYARLAREAEAREKQAVIRKIVEAESILELEPGSYVHWDLGDLRSRLWELDEQLKARRSQVDADNAGYAKNLPYHLG